MSGLFDKLQASTSPAPAELKALVAKVFGPGTTLRRAEPGEFTTPLKDHHLADLVDLEAERQRIAEEWRKSTRNERRRITTARNKLLRSVGLEPTHWRRIVRNHYGAPPEVMDEIVAGYLAADDPNEYSKQVHWTPPPPAPEPPRPTTKYVPGTKRD